MPATYNSTDNSDITCAIVADHVVPGTDAHIRITRYDRGGIVTFLVGRQRGEVEGVFAFNPSHVYIARDDEAEARREANKLWADGRSRARVVANS